MNTQLHTVTIPLQDYQEMIAAINNGNAKFDRRRDELIAKLETMPIPDSRYMTPRELVWEIIKVVKAFK